MNQFEDITFKTLSYRKNYDMIVKNENIITELEGTITNLRIEKDKLPELIGEFELSIWNVRVANLLRHNLYELLKSEEGVNTYDELSNIVSQGKFDLNKYNKIVFVHTLLIRDDYRGTGITEEFVEYLYREYYNDDNTIIIALVKPFQNNRPDYLYFINERVVRSKDELHGNEKISTTLEFFSLNKFIEKDDDEMNEYKLFSAAKKCGFKRMNDDFHLFELDTDIVEKKLISKLT